MRLILASASPALLASVDPAAVLDLGGGADRLSAVGVTAYHPAMIKPSSVLVLALSSPLAVLACSSGTGTPTGTGTGTGGAAATATASTGTGKGGAGGDIEPITVSTGTGSGTGAGGASCDPPDVLIALDRTLTMHKTPDGSTPTDAPAYASSKWSQALTAIKGLVTPKLDQGIRFGLEMWPKDPGMGCVTLAERVMGKTSTNPFCEDGEILVPPGLGTSSKIAPLLDPATAHICISTPTGQALLTASAYLKANKSPGRGQYIMLVTDGADWDQSCPMPDPLEITQQLATDGIKTFILGFSATGEIKPGGTGAPFLNNMACAGLTAKGFPDTCVMTAAGYMAKDPTGQTLYLQASDGAALSTAFDGIATELCCNCVN